MISFKQYLAEARMAPLYHATSVRNAAMILKRNTLEARTTQNIDGTKKVKGSSFTRNFKYAIYYGYHDAGHNAVVVFEVDQQKLGHRNRIAPMNYWNTSTVRSSPRYSNKARQQQGQPGVLIDTNNEFEEFVVGDVKDFNRCISRIIITSNLTMDEAKRHPELADHKLLWDKTDARYKGNWANK